jgi:hypothetical protein
MRTDSSTLESPLDECNVARIAGLSVASVRRWRLMKVILRYDEDRGGRLRRRDPGSGAE